MTLEQKILILEAWEYCDDEDKSTEFMLQYMSDISGLDYDEVVEYLSTDQSSADYENYLNQNYTEIK